MRLSCRYAVFGVIAAVVPASAADLGVSGLWYTPDQACIVEIADCGDGTPCGRIVSIDEAKGGMAWDENNRDNDLRGRHMVGVTLLHGFERDSGRWRAGAIYNPEDGRTYRARLELVSDNELAVSGCLGPICKKLIWERAVREAPKAAAQAEPPDEVASL